MVITNGKTWTVSSVNVLASIAIVSRWKIYRTKLEENYDLKLKQQFNLQQEV